MSFDFDLTMEGLGLVVQTPMELKNKVLFSQIKAEVSLIVVVNYCFTSLFTNGHLLSDIVIR